MSSELPQGPPAEGPSSQKKRGRPPRKRTQAPHNRGGAHDGDDGGGRGEPFHSQRVVESSKPGNQRPSPRPPAQQRRLDKNQPRGENNIEEDPTLMTGTGRVDLERRPGSPGQPVQQPLDGASKPRGGNDREEDPGVGLKPDAPRLDPYGKPRDTACCNPNRFCHHCGWIRGYEFEMRLKTGARKERDQAREERDQARKERDQALRELADTQGEKNKEIDQLRKEIDQVRKEIDQLRKEIDQLKNAARGKALLEAKELKRNDSRDLPDGPAKSRRVRFAGTEEALLQPKGRKPKYRERNDTQSLGTDDEDIPDEPANEDSLRQAAAGMVKSATRKLAKTTGTRLNMQNRTAPRGNPERKAERSAMTKKATVSP